MPYMARTSVVTTVEFKVKKTPHILNRIHTSVVTTVEFKVNWYCCFFRIFCASVVTTVEFKVCTEQGYLYIK